MRYRNKKTGAVIDVASELGGVWEPLGAPTAKKPTEKTGTEEKKPAKKGEKK